MRPVSKLLALAAMVSLATPALAAVRPAMTPLATTGKAFSLKRSARQGESAGATLGGGGFFSSAVVFGIVGTVVVVTTVVLVTDDDSPTSN